MNDSETLAAILAELRALRRELAARPSRVLIPEDVRRTLGADSVICSRDGQFWRLVVWFGPIPDGIRPTESVDYSALSSEGFSTEEAINAIARQQPDLTISGRDK